MWRYVAGGLSVALLVIAGVIMFNSRARSFVRLPAAPTGAEQVAGADGSLPDTVPEASDRTREQKRFDRYDKDRNGAVTREEYLASRRKAYAKLDLNQDGQLSFDEWAAKTTTKFAAADDDRSGSMNPAEFVKTAPKRAKTRPNCPPPVPRDEDS